MGTPTRVGCPFFVPEIPPWSRLAGDGVSEGAIASKHRRRDGAGLKIKRSQPSAAPTDCISFEGGVDNCDLVVIVRVMVLIFF